jgi:hypothetical protein
MVLTDVKKVMVAAMGDLQWQRGVFSATKTCGTCFSYVSGVEDW